MGLRAIVAAAAACLVAAVLVAVAPATIVPQKGIAGVRLGMGKAKVRAILGKPARIRRGRNRFGSFAEYRYRGLTVFFQGGGGATSVSTTRRSERTRSGVGVGSSERRLRTRVRGLRCRTELGFRHCFLGRFLPGRRVTDFRIRRGRVTSVVVGIVID